MLLIIILFSVQVTYKDYYKKMYDIEIRNLQQPMLITKAKKRDMNRKNADVGN